MDPDHLRAFIHVAEHGSFSRAASTLFITQPAVSKRISCLEAELNTALFDRIGHKIMLTAAGDTLLPRARRILLDIDDSKRAVANLSDDIAGPLQLGTSHHIGLHRLPPVLKQFTQSHPQVLLNIQFMDSEEACSSVIHGDLELGIVTLPLAPDRELKLIPIWDDPLVIVANKEHALAKQKNVSVKSLAQHNAILPATGTFTREVLEQTIKPLGLKLQVSMSTNYLETISMLVTVGLGWSVLPRTMLDNNLVEIKVKGIDMHRSLGIVFHTERTLSNAAQELIRILKENYAC